MVLLICCYDALVSGQPQFQAIANGGFILAAKLHSTQVTQERRNVRGGESDNFFRNVARRFFFI